MTSHWHKNLTVNSGARHLNQKIYINNITNLFNKQKIYIIYLTIYFKCKKNANKVLSIVVSYLLAVFCRSHGVDPGPMKKKAKILSYDNKDNY